MFRQEEYDEGKKDARMDNLKGVKRDLSLYMNENYTKGYKSYRPPKKKNKIKGGK